MLTCKKKTFLYVNVVWNPKNNGKCFVLSLKCTYKKETEKKCILSSLAIEIKF